VPRILWLPLALALVVVAPAASALPGLSPLRLAQTAPVRDPATATAAASGLPVLQVVVIPPLGDPLSVQVEAPDLTKLATYPSLAKLAPGAPLPEPEARAVTSEVRAAALQGSPTDAPAPDDAVPLPFFREAPLPPSILGGTAPSSFQAPARDAAVDPTEVSNAPAAPAPVAAAGGLAAVALLGFALYTRLAPSAVLQSPVRRALLEAIRADPGCTPHALARALGLDDKTVRHHLRVLRRAGCVTAAPGAQERLFVNGDIAPADMRTTLALRAPSARALHDALQIGPARGAELARALGLHEATVSVQLRRLAEAGLARRGADGRWVRAS